MTIDIKAAGELLDFGARIGPGQRAQEQLEGAVAIHNILERHRIAYLADEVGMGKTFVALGALALFRHYKPNFRALIIAPRENIQRKWMKEQRNFVANNVKHADLRVKNIDSLPARRMMMCNDLFSLAREASLDPDADFYCRMTSFSLGVAGKETPAPEEVRRLRDRFRAEFPWIREEVFDARDKQALKDNIARALCSVLPQFDLVIIDEAHNLKHGFRENSAARNRVLGLALGRGAGDTDTRLFPHYGNRAERVLLLSATPVEESYRQLWNQLDVLGKAGAFAPLKDESATEAQKKEVAGRFLVRRVTSIRAGEDHLTKNLYRRTWERGGLAAFDDPITITDTRQKLIVALVQKKVSELLQTERFNASFQIGMLASFESFLQTAKLKEDDEQVFDDAEQTEDAIEREGIDVHTLNRLASDFRKKFGRELPHPKMDALVDALATSWLTGKKALIFVRRVASVKELKRKLDERYDSWLIGRLRTELPQQVSAHFEETVKDYQRARLSHLQANRSEDPQRKYGTDSDKGGADTFFAWYFRGEGPPGVISGANIQQRFTQAGTVFSTFFEDNYVAAVLDCPPREVTERLAAAIGVTVEELRQQLRVRSRHFLRRVQKQARGHLFEAMQAAAIQWLKNVPGPHQEKARVIWHERFETSIEALPADEAPPIGDWLELETFFTVLRSKPELCARLWPASKLADPRQAFRETELRRQFLATAARLGHAFIDLYILVIDRLRSLSLRAQEEDDGSAAGTERIAAYVALLESQMRAPPTERAWCAYDELAAIAAQHELLVDVNLPDAGSMALSELGPALGQLLRQQQPVGGMSGQVNQTLVRQFRMPGYPLVLVATDLLQEGEDLHTFCSVVHHYGLAWTPSAMEQRIGRVDRVRSATERSLTALGRTPDGDEKLQVHLPHLVDTVEALQVRRVLERMDTFLRLMHETLAVGGHDDPKIDINKEIHRQTTAAPRKDTVPLKTAFPIDPKWLKGTVKKPTAGASVSQTVLARLTRIEQAALPGLTIAWEKEQRRPGTLLGTVALPNRIQPFAIRADQFAGALRLRCVSPVGRIHPQEIQARLEESAWELGVRLGAIPAGTDRTYDLTVEEDVVLGADAEDDIARVTLMLQNVVAQADRLEQIYVPGLDQPLVKFSADLLKESADGT